MGGVLLALSGCASPNAPSAHEPGKTQQAEAAVIRPAERQEAPGIAGDDLAGQPTALADFGGKIVVVNVWGSWCSPCRAEAAVLEEIHRDMRPQGVRFLGINTRDRQTKAARSFEQTYGLTFRSLYDPAGRLLLQFPADILNPQAIPSTMVIDRRGRIAASVSGPVTKSGLRSMITHVLEEGT
ncbi:TlpA disulfide reductase family protein [Streptomyces sp. NPDC126514]|uniref:TlpA family protein disulfide reductase n=1 Tax=Streptomyces sp. NPDC126514 TaxID=3155210 RepID=UPI00332F4D41